MNFIDIGLSIFGALILLAVFFSWGYLFASKEFGKDVKFYKDRIRNQRTVLIATEKAHLEAIEDLSVNGKEKALLVFLEQELEKTATAVYQSVPGSLDNASKRGERYGLWRVLLHVQGRI